MDDEIRKQLNETISMQESYIKIPQTFTNLKQYLNFKKHQMVLDKKIEILSNELSTKRFLLGLNIFNEKASLKILKLKLPLLWMEEAKKKDNFTGYAFYIFSHLRDVVETEIFEFTSSTQFLSFQTIKICNVSPDTKIKVELYYNIFENSQMKKYLKSIDSDSENFRFNLIGSGGISIKELVSLKQKTILITTPSVCELSVFGSANKSPALSMNRSMSSSLASAWKVEPNKCYYGIKLHYWHKAMAELDFAPNNLHSEYSRFSAVSSFSKDNPITLIAFDGDSFDIYKTSMSYLEDPVMSLKICDINLKVMEDNKSVAVFHSIHGKQGQIEFSCEENRSGFEKYFNEYKKAIQIWGPNIDCKQHKTKPLNIISQITQTPLSMFHLLSETSKLNVL